MRVSNVYVSLFFLMKKGKCFPSLSCFCSELLCLASLLLEPAFNLSNDDIRPLLWECQDWEDGLCESDADGSFLHENLNHDLRLFSDGEDGAYKLLQVHALLVK